MKANESANNNYYKDFEKDIISKKLNNKYNTYYNKLYEYMLSNKEPKYDLNGIRQEKYSDFSLRNMVKLFVESVLEEINYMIENYYSEDLDLDLDINIKPTNQVIKEEKYRHKITCFKELFISSKYYISISGKYLKKCKICMRYFVTETGNKTLCKRIYKNGLTCSQLGNKYSTAGNSLEKQIKSELKSIKNMLDRRGDLDFFSTLETEFSINIEKYGDSDKVLKWLQEKHEELKKKNM